MELSQRASRSTGQADDTWRRGRGWALWKALATMAGLSSPDTERFQNKVLTHVLQDPGCH